MKPIQNNSLRSEGSLPLKPLTKAKKKKFSHFEKHLKVLKALCSIQVVGSFVPKKT